MINLFDEVVRFGISVGVIFGMVVAGYAALFLIYHGAKGLYKFLGRYF